MSLSDCPKCWDTPCTCGHMYKNHYITTKREVIYGILKDCTSEEFKTLCEDLFEITLDKYDNIKITLKKI